MIAVDMDGTLLDADGKVSARNLAAMRSAELAGVEVVVATGRRHSYAMRQLRGLELSAGHVLVSSNGAVTRTVDAELVERTLMARSTALWLCEYLGEFRNALVVTFDTVGRDGDDRRGALVVEDLDDLHRSIDKWMVANAPYIEHVRPIERALEGDEAPLQMMLCGTVERMRRAEALLLRDARVVGPGAGLRNMPAGVEIELSRTEYPERDLSIVDILPAGCSKGAALLRLLRRRGLKADQMMAIGDNFNDISMLEVAGRPVLMGNAPEELQAVAAERGWTIAGRNDEDGAALEIEAVLRESAEQVDAIEGDVVGV
jgi:HAD superfamily hydrolase (TIGR01484 family)